MGVLAKAYPTAYVKEVLKRGGKASQRERELPAHLMVYYILGLAMWMGASYREVLRCLLSGVQWLLVRQEFYGFLMFHFAVRSFMHEAALSVNRDADELSFVHAVRVLKRRVPLFVISPSRRTRRTVSGHTPGNTGGASSTPMGTTHIPGSQTQDESLFGSPTWQRLSAHA